MAAIGVHRSINAPFRYDNRSKHRLLTKIHEILAYTPWGAHRAYQATLTSPGHIGPDRLATDDRPGVSMNDGNSSDVLSRFTRYRAQQGRRQGSYWAFFGSSVDCEEYRRYRLLAARPFTGATATTTVAHSASIRTGLGGRAPSAV